MGAMERSGSQDLPALEHVAVVKRLANSRTTVSETEGPVGSVTEPSERFGAAHSERVPHSVQRVGSWLVRHR